MSKWNVKYRIFGTITVEADDEDGAIAEAQELLDEEVFGFGPEIDGADLFDADRLT